MTDEVVGGHANMVPYLRDTPEINLWRAKINRMCEDARSPGSFATRESALKSLELYIIAINWFERETGEYKLTCLSADFEWEYISRMFKEMKKNLNLPSLYMANKVSKEESVRTPKKIDRKSVPALYESLQDISNRTPRAS